MASNNSEAYSRKVENFVEEEKDEMMDMGEKMGGEMVTSPKKNEKYYHTITISDKQMPELKNDHDNCFLLIEARKKRIVKDDKETKYDLEIRKASYLDYTDGGDEMDDEEKAPVEEEVKKEEEEKVEDKKEETAA